MSNRIDTTPAGIERMEKRVAKFRERYCDQSGGPLGVIPAGEALADDVEALIAALDTARKETAAWKELHEALIANEHAREVWMLAVGEDQHRTTHAEWRSTVTRYAEAAVACGIGAIK